MSLPAGGRILKLHKNDLLTPDCFVTMAAALGHNLFRRPCPPTQQSSPPYIADLIVDIRSLEMSVRNLLDTP